MVRLSFKTKPQETSWRAMEETWEAAEGLEVLETGWLFDHFVPIHTEDIDAPCFEGWTALAYLAGRTQRLRLGLMVSSVTYRHPAVLANMVATLDVASGGRLDLGLGAGWFEQEHRAYGLDFPSTVERLRRLDDACAVIDALLTQSVANHAGPFYTLTDARCEPKPVQRPRPPLVVGGNGERYTLRTVARWADEWNYPGRDPDELRHKREVLRRHCDDLGRDPGAIATSVHLFPDQDRAAMAAEARALVAAGADHLILYLAPGYPAEGLGTLTEEVADAVC